MNLILSQLRAAYEADPGGEETVSALASQFGLETDVVKALLQNESPAYRLRQEELKAGVDESGNVIPDPVTNPYNEHPALEIPDEIIRLINASMIETALGSGDERLKFRAQCRLIDERKGRLDKSKLMPVGNVTIINNHFEQLKRERELRKARKAIDVSAKTISQPANPETTPA